jgi:hypothetical protein
MLGKKAIMKKMVKHAWLAADCPAKANAIPNRPTQKVSTALTIGTTAKLIMLGIAVFKIKRSNSFDDSFVASDAFVIDEEEWLVKMCGKACRKRVRLDWDSVVVLDKVVEVVGAVVVVASRG